MPDLWSENAVRLVHPIFISLTVKGTNILAYLSNIEKHFLNVDTCGQCYKTLFLCIIKDVFTKWDLVSKYCISFNWNSTGCTIFTALSVHTIGTEHYVYMESSRKKIYVPCEKYGPNVHYTL